MNAARNVAILIFNDVEVLDFCGPFEVFSATGRSRDALPFRVFTVAENSGAITARNGLSVNPAFTFADCPAPDILVVPGGYGTRRLLENNRVLDWIREQTARVELLLSVCTGSLLLAKAGLLDGREATTHHLALDLLRQLAPAATVRPEKRFIDNGKVIVAAGVSAGLDMSLHVVARLLGKEEALATAQYIEYTWRNEP